MSSHYRSHAANNNIEDTLKSLTQIGKKHSPFKYTKNTGQKEKISRKALSEALRFDIPDSCRDLLDVFKAYNFGIRMLTAISYKGSDDFYTTAFYEQSKDNLKAFDYYNFLKFCKPYMTTERISDPIHINTVYRIDTRFGFAVEERKERPHNTNYWSTYWGPEATTTVSRYQYFSEYELKDLDNRVLYKPKQQIFQCSLGIVNMIHKDIFKNINARDNSINESVSNLKLPIKYIVSTRNITNKFMLKYFNTLDIIAIVKYLSTKYKYMLNAPDYDNPADPNYQLLEIPELSLFEEAEGDAETKGCGIADQINRIPVFSFTIKLEGKEKVEIYNGLTFKTLMKDYVADLEPVAKEEDFRVYKVNPKFSISYIFDSDSISSTVTMNLEVRIWNNGYVTVYWLDFKEGDLKTLGDIVNKNRWDTLVNNRDGNNKGYAHDMNTYMLNLPRIITEEDSWHKISVQTTTTHTVCYQWNKSSGSEIHHPINDNKFGVEANTKLEYQSEPCAEAMLARPEESLEYYPISSLLTIPEAKYVPAPDCKLDMEFINTHFGSLTLFIELIKDAIFHRFQTQHLMHADRIAYYHTMMTALKYFKEICKSENIKLADYRVPQNAYMVWSRSFKVTPVDHVITTQYLTAMYRLGMVTSSDYRSLFEINSGAKTCFRYNVERKLVLNTSGECDDVVKFVNHEIDTIQVTDILSRNTEGNNGLFNIKTVLQNQYKSNMSVDEIRAILIRGTAVKVL